MTTPVSSGSSGTRKPYGSETEPYGEELTKTNGKTGQKADSAKPYDTPHRPVLRPTHAMRACKREHRAARALLRIMPAAGQAGVDDDIDRGDGIATDGGQRVAKAPIEDDDLLATLEAAEDEHGSMAEALRAIIRDYGTDDDSTSGTEADLSHTAQQAHKYLQEECVEGNQIGLDVAESVLAQRLGIDSEAVRARAIRPLEAADLVTVNPGLYSVTIIVHGNDAQTQPDTAADAQEVPADD